VPGQCNIQLFVWENELYVYCLEDSSSGVGPNYFLHIDVNATTGEMLIVNHYTYTTKNNHALIECSFAVDVGQLWCIETAPLPYQLVHVLDLITFQFTAIPESKNFLNKIPSPTFFPFVSISSDATYFLFLFSTNWNTWYGKISTHTWNLSSTLNYSYGQPLLPQTGGQSFLVIESTEDPNSMLVMSADFDAWTFGEPLLLQNQSDFNFGWNYAIKGNQLYLNSYNTRNQNQNQDSYAWLAQIEANSDGSLTLQSAILVDSDGPSLVVGDGFLFTGTEQGAQRTHVLERYTVTNITS